MKIAICDDEANCREDILDFIHDYAEECKDKAMDTKTFSSPEELLNVTDHGEFYDIYLLDIIMPKMNGIQLGELIRNAGADGKIIYLSSSKDYALDSFRVRAFNYLVKPVEKANLFKALDEAISSLQIKKDKGLIIKTKDGSVRITVDSILYAKLSKRSVVYHLTNGKTLETTTLRGSFTDAMAELLLDKRFVQCGVAAIVNLHHISAVQNEAIIFSTMEQIYFNPKLCRELRSKWNNYWTCEEI